MGVDPGVRDGWAAACDRCCRHVGQRGQLGGVDAGCPARGVKDGQQHPGVVDVLGARQGLNQRCDVGAGGAR